MNSRMLKIVSAFIFLLTFAIAEQSVQASEVDFTVRAILPENQRDKASSFFDLRVKPGETQTLNVELENDTDKDIIVFASANAAITNDNGSADYSYKKTEKDPSAMFIFSEIAKMPKEILLPKKSKKIVDVVMTIPNKEFNGFILGGLYFEQKEEEQPKASKESLAVGNRFSYVIGVLLSENDQEVKPELALNKVKATQVNGHNVVSMNIQNKQPAMIKKLQIVAKLYYEDEQKPRYENHQETMTMAPNTNFNYKIDLKDQRFVAGNYTVKIKANDGFKDWSWERKFKIKEKEARKYNASAVNLPPEKKPFISLRMLVGLIILLLLAIACIIYYFNRKIKQEQLVQQEKYNELKQSMEQDNKVADHKSEE